MEELNLIVAAMDIEVQALLDNIDSYQEIDIDDSKGYRFILNNEKYLLVKGKIGKVNTAFYLGRLALNYKIKRVFNIGTSGGVDKSLKINDVIVATKVGYHDVDVTFFGDYELGQMPGSPRYFECDNDFIDSKKIDDKYSIKRGIILSGDSFIHKGNYKSTNVYTSKDCLSCEMEAAAVGQVCYTLNIPFVVIRSISDLIFENIDEENNDNNFISSSTNSALVLLEYLK